MNEAIYDFIQVGYGPVGQVLATTLGQQGHSVAVYERHSNLFHLARAGHIDHEVMRIFQGLGVAGEMEESILPMSGMDIVDGNQNVLLTLTGEKWGISGWRQDYNVHQHELETVLDAAARKHPNVVINQGYEVIGLEQHADYVEAQVRRAGAAAGQAASEVETVRARYLIGADGSNSVVRRAVGSTFDDLGYAGKWLVCDFEHQNPDVELAWKGGRQVLDPSRPTTLGRWIGRRHSRIEFMLMPGEDELGMQEADIAWGLADKWGITPETSRLDRHAVYTFEARLASSWRDRRVLLVGDAAHQMPPFLGQGLCSGLRDVAALAWRLDLVARGLADADLLDTYEFERSQHVKAVTMIAIGLGEMICITDPAQAAARDAMIREGTMPRPPQLPGVLAGVLHREADGSVVAGVGDLSLQARVKVDGRLGLFDDVVGRGWQIISRVAVRFSPAQQRLAADLNMKVAYVSAGAVQDSVRDWDFDYDTWFSALDAELVIVRPDFYMFAVLRDAAELGAALDDLALQLHLRAPDPQPLDSDATSSISVVAP